MFSAFTLSQSGHGHALMVAARARLQRSIIFNGVGAVATLTDDPASAETLRMQWEEWQCGVQLTIIESPFRSLVGPLLAYIDAMHAQHPHKTLTVVLPEMGARPLVGAGSA